MDVSPEQGLSAWVEYLRDMGVYDLYRRAEPSVALPPEVLERLRRAPAVSAQNAPAGLPSKTGRPVPAAPVLPARAHARPAVPQPASPGAPVLSPVQPAPERNYFNTDDQGPPDARPRVPERSAALPPELAAPMPKPNPLEALFAAPPAPVPAGERAAALAQLQAEIGDCTRCPLAYAGRHTIVFGEGDPNAALMFVGEGPGADEDASGRPFVGKAGQLLTNMIGAMGLQREQVFIANIVKCRPPGNRTPEFVEATTCSQFLLKQIDIVRPKVIVALGSTAATYVLGVRQSLATLRGQWFQSRGAKVAVTYHPAFLLRDPRQKGEAWRDLQRVMTELGLKGAAKS